MVRSMKKMTVFVLILFLSFVSVFCCCLTGIAKAELHYKTGQNGTDGNKCCSAKTNKADSKEHKECGCEKVAGILADEGFSISNFRSSSVSFSDKTLSLSVQAIISNTEFMNKHYFMISYLLVKSDPPIYLQNAVLRI